MGVLLTLVCCVAGDEGEELVFRQTSAFNAILVIDAEDGLRTLCFDDPTLRQSVAKVSDPDHIELSYVKTMMAGQSVVPNPQTMLFIGLGGGTLPSFLHRHYPQTDIDAVEIDPVVVRVAREYFAFREDSLMRVHVCDGRQFIEACDHPYDIIFVDAYGSENIPYRLATREFLRTVRRIVTDRGVVVANILGSKRNGLYGSMVRTYEDVFDDVCILDVEGSGNRVILALPRERQFRGIDLARKARAVSRDRGFRFDMGEFVLNGFHLPSEETKHAKVLLDRDESANSALTVPTR